MNCVNSGGDGGGGDSSYQELFEYHQHWCLPEPTYQERYLKINEILPKCSVLELWYYYIFPGGGKISAYLLCDDTTVDMFKRKEKLANRALDDIKRQDDIMYMRRYDPTYDRM